MNFDLVNYARIFVFFFVCSSKQIFIYNEETLVALCFVAFMVFSFSYFGASIQEFFDERKVLIQTELQEFTSLKENCLSSLLNDYQKSSKTVSVLRDMNQFCTDQLAVLCNSKKKSSIRFFITSSTKITRIKLFSKIIRRKFTIVNFFRIQRICS